MTSAERGRAPRPLPAGRPAPSARELVAARERYLGRRVLALAGAYHYRPSPYGGHVGRFGGERAFEVVAVVAGDGRGGAQTAGGLWAVYEVPHSRPPFFDVAVERWWVALDEVVELEPGAEERARLSPLAG